MVFEGAADEEVALVEPDEREEVEVRPEARVLLLLLLLVDDGRPGERVLLEGLTGASVLEEGLTGASRLEVERELNMDDSGAPRTEARVIAEDCRLTCPSCSGLPMSTGEAVVDGVKQRESSRIAPSNSCMVVKEGDRPAMV